PKAATPLQELSYLQHSEKWYAMYDYATGTRFKLNTAMQAKANDFDTRTEQFQLAAKDLAKVKAYLEGFVGSLKSK
ncbi:MAG: hypothetical protein AAFV80_24200, partial [Bacteroidota bacterium]